MSLNIKNPATVALADELARRQGISKTAAIHQALSERLHRLGFGETAQERLLTELRAIREEWHDYLNWIVAATRRSSSMTSMESLTDGDRYLSCCSDPSERA
ncbi:type II toxin-antitoxin system VapB family antitoxin [Mesorhizobium sp. M0909]|uniref:type II toxin-antitoxin system VapB family antitoxin n=1 Tax=Mesorhizobium sp. M0909 TaxID=2957024 RepID=UPI00333A3EE6